MSESLSDGERLSWDSINFAENSQGHENDGLS